MIRRTLLLATAAVFGLPSSVRAQAEPKPGTFGFAIYVDGEGFFLNPTLKTVTIKSVAPGRPASVAGIKPGDQIMEIEGTMVAGAKARDLEPYLRRSAGEKVTLQMRKPSGELYSATLVAAPKRD
jgi:C-terminal processing protease CtpA/Prc